MTINNLSTTAGGLRSQLMTVGELSRHTGVPIKNLREYTDTGLIYTVGRSRSNYRLYDTDALWCVRWIGELRGLGLTVAEIRGLTARHDPDWRRSFGPRLAERLRESRRRLQARIAQLEQTLQRVDAFESAYRAELAREGDTCWAVDPRCPADRAQSEDQQRSACPSPRGEFLASQSSNRSRAAMEELTVTTTNTGTGTNTGGTSRAGNAISEFAAGLGVTLMNQAQDALPPAWRELHRAILGVFVDTGAAPTTTWITERATQLGVDPDQALPRLAEADLVHTANGSVTVAYPFSGTATPHRVQFDDGPAVWAMCGGDALGIPLMTRRTATITSADPHTGEPIRIRYHGGGDWEWEPDNTVMLVAGTIGCRTAAEAACRHVHFFTHPDHARAYLQANPALSGQVYDQADSIGVGQVIFGSLLGR